MDFKDWRKVPNKPEDEEAASKTRPSKYRGKAYYHYIDEQIQRAQERGEFDHLEGYGKPLNLRSNHYAGDMALGYNLLQSNGYAPPEIEMANDIRQQREKAEAKIEKLCQKGQVLRSRQVSPFSSEKRVYNTQVEEALIEYEHTLRELNRKILTLNLTAPSPMHQPMFEVEKLLEQARQKCPML